MHAPVPMLSGYAAKSDSALVLGLLVALAVVAAVKACQSHATSRSTP